MASGLQTIDNLNISWCKLILDALVDAGVAHVFISPGYRDAPFAACLSQHETLRATSCMDERSAAYLALGAAKASAKPSALICTSGTAVANYLPAVIEAHETSTAIVVVSCDRPPELIRSGANQTIDQNRILGSFAQAYLGLPCPEDEISANQVRAMVARTLEKG